MLRLSTEISKLISIKAFDLQADMVVFRTFKKKKNRAQLQTELSLFFKHSKNLWIMLYVNSIRKQTYLSWKNDRKNHKLFKLIRRNKSDSLKIKKKYDKRV